jgi:hypothetical protein
MVAATPSLTSLRKIAVVPVVRIDEGSGDVRTGLGAENFMDGTLIFADFAPGKIT